MTWKKLFAATLIPVILLVLAGSKYLSSGSISPDATPETEKEIGTVQPIRAIWVQYDAASTPEKADQMLESLAEAGFDTVLYLVGSGSVVYKSDLLPHQTEIESDYDPLAYVVKQGHAKGLKVQAWWCPGYAENDSRFRNLHPDWDIAAIEGIPEDAHWLNFSLPEVQQFVGDVVVEIAQNYDVDGVHLDYIRYPTPSRSRDFRSYFNRGDVPNTVQNAYQALKALKPNVLLTAAVMDSQQRSNANMQFWSQWLAGGYIDYVMPMAYYSPSENSELERDIAEWQNLPGHERIVPGLSVAYSNNQGKTDRKAPEQLSIQIGLAAKSNFQSFSIFDSEAITTEILDKLPTYNSGPP